MDDNLLARALQMRLQAETLTLRVMRTVTRTALTVQRIQLRLRDSHRQVRSSHALIDAYPDGVPAPDAADAALF